MPRLDIFGNVQAYGSMGPNMTQMQGQQPVVTIDGKCIHCDVIAPGHMQSCPIYLKDGNVVVDPLGKPPNWGNSNPFSSAQAGNIAQSVGVNTRDFNAQSVIDRAVKNSPPPLDDVGGVNINDFDEKDLETIKKHEYDTWAKRARDMDMSINGTTDGDNDYPPLHYNTEVQPIHLIEAGEKAGFVGYREGQIIKYLFRWRVKNGLRDLKAAAWFLNRMIAQEEGKDV